MLKENGYSKDDIVSFKIVNGDEIVAKFIEETDTEFVVNKPATVMPSQQGIGLMQSLFTGGLDKNIKLQKTHVMIHSETVKEIKDHYIKTTTGIEPVSAGSIVI